MMTKLNTLIWSARLNVDKSAVASVCFVCETCCQKTTHMLSSRIFKWHWIALAFSVLALSRYVAGQIPAEPIPVHRAEAISKTDGTVLLVRDQPFFARVIQHNGESFGFLKSLGFNTIQLAASATPDQLAEAAASGIWLVCPPPSSVGLRAIGFNYDPVIAWTGGDKVTGRHVQFLNESVREIRASDRRVDRPVLATISSHYQTMANLVDIPVIGCPTISSSFPSRNYSDWVSARTRLSAKPFWVDIPTHAPQTMTRQALAMSINNGPLPLQHQQLKFLIYEAITGGSRGIRFLSRERLDVVDPTTQLRALSLLWVMRHLDQIQPWISGGLVQQIQSGSAAEQLHRIRLGDSELILVQRTTGLEQHVAGDVAVKKYEVKDLDCSVSAQSYRVDELGAQLITNTRDSTRPTITFENCPYAAAALVTQSPGAVAIVNQATTGSNSDSLFQQRFQLSEQALAVVQLIQQRLSQQGQSADVEVESAIGQSVQHLGSAQRMISAGDQERAMTHLDTADAFSSFARRKWIETRFDPRPGIVVSPLLMNVGLIPDHDSFSVGLAEATWNPNALPAGDFENLDQMLESGWANRREDLPNINSLVTLEKTAAYAGSYGLKMFAETRSAESVVPVAPVSVQSAEVAVKAGQLVRIHGYVRLPRPLTGNGQGLLIIDSLGGRDLASRIEQTDGWQEFTIYRMSERPAQVSVKFGLSGFGTALVDEVTIRTLENSASRIEARQLNPDLK